MYFDHISLPELTPAWILVFSPRFLPNLNPPTESNRIELKYVTGDGTIKSDEFIGSKITVYEIRLSIVQFKTTEFEEKLYLINAWVW